MVEFHRYTLKHVHTVLREKIMRRLLSLTLAVAMVFPAFASVAEAAVGTWLSPPAGQVVSGPAVEVAVGYNTQSDTKVTSLELWIDGKLYVRRHLSQPSSRGVASFMWDTSKVSKGSHQLVVKIFSDDKLISTVSGTGTVGSGNVRPVVDTRPPVVTFSHIRSGDVLKGKTDVEIKAYDDSGEPPLVSLLVDDVLKLLKNTPPYHYELDTTTYNDGDHQLTTYAYDIAGNCSDPVIVKVAFKNGIAKPIVAAMTIDTLEKTEPAKGAQVQAKTEPAAPAIPVPVDASAAVAGRTAEPATASAAAAVPVAPVMILPDPTIALSAPEPPAEISAPASSAEPGNVALPEPIAEIVSENAEPAADSGSLLAAQPMEKDARAVAGSEVSASVVPDTIAVASTALAASSTAVEPEVSTAPKAAEVEQMAALPGNSALQLEDTVKVMGFAAEVPSIELSDPRMSEAANLVASVLVDDLAESEESYRNSGRTPTPAAPEIKKIQLAMASDAELLGGKPKPTMNSVPTIIKQQVKARIEKTTIPASGKIKARDLFEKLGGVLLWDPSTHVVSAFVDNMRIDLQIGSKVAKVNGTEMLIDTAPYIVDGRTIIDASVYHAARAMVAHGKQIAKGS